MHRAILMTVLAAAHLAWATDQFPGAIQAHLALADLPPQSCTLCHEGIATAGTVNTPFGKAMRQRGLMPSDVNSLAAALDSLAADKVDSDGDGMSDVDELKAARNPNGPDIPPLIYGCGATAVPGVLCLAWLLPLWSRRRRNRSNF